MPRSTIGLDIGSTAVRAAQLSYGPRGAVLEKIGQQPLPEGAVQDGAVVDAAAVTAALRQLWRTERFASRRVHIGVGNQRVVVREVTVPDMPADDLALALPYQVQDLLPVPVDSVVMDFHPLERTTAEDGSAMVRGLLVAAARDLVGDNVAAVEAAGLTVESVDLVPFAVLRAVGSRLGGAEGVEALVDVGASVTSVIIHRDGVASFVRILASGGADLTEAVCEGAGVSLTEAEDFKRFVGLVPAPRDGGVDEVDDADDALDADLHRSLERAVRQLAGDLRGTLAYYAASHPDRPAERVVLSGGGAVLAGFAELLADDLRLPVEVADPSVHLHGGRHSHGLGDPLTHLPSSAVPVGLAMGAAL